MSDSHLPCRAHAIPDHAILLKATAQYGHLSTAELCRDLEKNGIAGAWHGYGMASVNKTRPHWVNKMGKIHSKPLATRHGMGTAWTRHGHGMLMCESALRRRSAVARLLRMWVRIPPEAWMFVCCECCVLSGRGLCDKLITRPEESYRKWCVVVCDLEKPHE